MKLKTLLLGLAFFSAAGLNANPISRAEARLVAQEFVGIDDNTSDNVPIAPYYVFSRGAGQGYVIVSGDDATTPIIGYTDNGDYNYDSLPEGLKEMLDAWAERIGRVQKAPKKNQIRRSPRERLELGRRGVESFKEKWDEVPILCPTHWHQNYPYNMFCPTNPDNEGQRAVTGCVATAASQIVYYFRKDNPDTLLYDTPTYSYGWPVKRVFKKGTPINYNLMRTSGSGTTAQDEAVGTLMAVVGACSYLTYGSSTSGQPNDAGNALAQQFHLDNTYVGKWNYSQQGWETVIYNSLKNGSPMLYGATNKDPKEGGHAVVLDGYQASTGLYHFNFGWGGQGDGWYTVDDETGMNGWTGDQRGCLNFKPRKQNLAGKLNVDMLYLKASNTIKATVKNNGTLPYKNFQLRVSTDKKMPSTANVTESTTLLKTNQSAEIEFVYKPTASKVYLFLTDEKGNLLDSCSITPTQTKSVLTVNKITVDAGEQTVTFNDKEYQVVNNTDVNACLTFTNGEGGTYSQPNIRCYVDKFDLGTNIWKQVGTKNIQDSIFHEGETKDMIFKFTLLSPGNYYRLRIDPTVRAGINTTLQYAVKDSMVYFVVNKADLKVEITDTKAVVSGSWNESLFESKMGDETVCVYDMTGVTQMTRLPKVPNPNALFYTNSPIQDAINNIVDDKCENLQIHTGYNFAPTAQFTAAKASLLLDDAKVEDWNAAFAPFSFTVPFGMRAKKPTSIESAAITVEETRNIDAMMPFMFVISNKNSQITAENVTVSPNTEMSYLDGEMYGTTTRSVADANWKVLGMNNNLPYFITIGEETVTVPFIPYVTKERNGNYRAFTATESNIDKVYRELGLMINKAYETLEENKNLATESQINTLQNAINASADIFTYFTINEVTPLRQEISTLEKAIQAFLEDVATAIDDIYVTSPSHNNAPIEYFTVSGVRLTQPQRGIVIVKQGDNVRKIIVR